MTIGQGGNYDYVGEAMMPTTKSMERCKPDYEAIIKKLNAESLEINKALQGLLQAHDAQCYIPGELTMAQAVGFLYLKAQDCQKALLHALAEQEASQ